MSNIPPIEDGYIDDVIKSSGPLKPNLNKTQGIELRALVKLLRDRLEGEISDHYASNQAALSQKANVDQVVLKTTKVNGKPLSGDIVLDKNDIGLGSVDNTPDLEKPLSSFAQAALALKANMVEVNERLSSKVDKVSGKQLSTEDFSSAEKDKLAGIQNGATSNQKDSYLLAREHHTGTQAVETITALRSELDSKVNQSEKGQVNGIATLDGSGKIPLGQLSEALLGSVNYQGNYNAAANTPTLPAAEGNKGKYFVVSVAGNQQSLELNIGDWIISNGDVWERVDNNNKVTSVNGKQGSVMLGKGDIGLGNADNTADAAKPVSAAQQAALDGKANNNGSNATGLWGVDISGNANTVSLLNGTQIFSAINGSNLATNTLNVNIFGRSVYSDRVANGASDMAFHWQGQGGQPDWLWGGNAPGDMYVYNPGEFNVASAGRLRNIMVHDFDVPTGFGFLEGAGTNIPNQPQYGSWGQGIQFSTNNNPTYANQLVFNENGALSTRYKAGAGWSGWDRIITESSLNNAISNLSGSYQPLENQRLSTNNTPRFENLSIGSGLYGLSLNGDLNNSNIAFRRDNQNWAIGSNVGIYNAEDRHFYINFYDGTNWANKAQFDVHGNSRFFGNVYADGFIQSSKWNILGVTNESYIRGDGEYISIRPSSSVRLLSIIDNDATTIELNARTGGILGNYLRVIGETATNTLNLISTTANPVNIDKILVGTSGMGQVFWSDINHLKSNILGLGSAAYMNASSVHNSPNQVVSRASDGNMGANDVYIGNRNAYVTALIDNKANIGYLSGNRDMNDYITYGLYEVETAGGIITNTPVGAANTNNFAFISVGSQGRNLQLMNPYGSNKLFIRNRYDDGTGVIQHTTWDKLINSSELGSAAYQNVSGGDDAWTGGTIIKYNSAGFIRTASKNYPQNEIPTSILGSKVGDDYMWSFTPQALRDFLNYNGAQIYTSIDNRDGDLEVAKYMRWKQHGNGHVIFDASAGTSPSGTVIDRNNSQVKVDDVVNPVLMGWNGTNTYGIRVEKASNADFWSRNTSNFSYGEIDYAIGSKNNTAYAISQGTFRAWLNIDLIDVLAKGNVAYDKAIGIDQYNGQPAPSISLAIGDSDTGFQRNGDGSTLYYSNGVALYQMNDAGGFRRFLGLNTDQTTVFANVITGNVNSVRIWNYYGNDTVNAYSWTDAATTTTSIEIVTRGSGDASQTESPTLAFHRYGSGGPQFRLDPTGTNVLYLESSGANSARDGRAYGGQANSYFTRFHIDGQLSVEGNLNLPSQSSNFFFRGNADNASYTGYNVGLKLWWGLGLTGYDDVIRGFYDARTGVWDVKTDFRIDGRSVTDMVTRLQSTSHNGVYYLENTWDGVHWWLRSNHGAPVKVGRADYADNAGTWSNQVWQDVNKSGAVTFMTNNAGGWGYSTLAQVQESLGVTSAIGRDFNNFVFGTNSTATSETNDFNTLLKSGFYNGSQPGSTAPANSWHHLINSAHSGSTPANIYNFQLSADFFSGDLFYIRTIVPAGPNPWRRITTDDRLANSAFTGMDVNPTGNTIVQRNNAGHAFATYFNSTDGTVEGFTPAALYAYNGTDGYLRKVNAGGIVNFLNINLQGVADRGNHEIWSNDNTSLGFNEAALIIRESNRGSNSSYLSPRIGFHWAGVVASQISMDTDGWLKIINNPGNDYESLRLKNLGASGQVRADNIYTDGNVDSNSLRIRGGVNVNSEGAFITWNNGQFGGMSFINQKGGGTGGFKWQSSDTANGRNDLMQLEEDGQLYLYSNLIVGEGKTSSSIIMRDTDETGRTIHCNSNRIGFLNAGGGWGSYSDNTGNWLSDFGMRGQWMDGLNYVSGGRVFSGYDSGVAGSVSANNWFRSSGQSGWYSSDYGGGIYMTDSTWVRVYANKGFWVDNSVVAGTGTNGGYANATYNQGHNNIWRLNSDPEYGLAYYQGMSGEDRIGFHFGNRNSPVFYVNTAGQVFATGGFYDTSDKRIKTLSTEVFDTRSIKARTYYKNDKLETGYFAQEVEEVMPQAVKMGQDNLLTLNYTQVLVAKVANLEDDIRLLQDEINLLRQGI